MLCSLEHIEIERFVLGMSSLLPLVMELKSSGLNSGIRLAKESRIIPTEPYY